MISGDSAIRFLYKFSAQLLRTISSAYSRCRKAILGNPKTKQIFTFQHACRFLPRSKFGHASHPCHVLALSTSSPPFFFPFFIYLFFLYFRVDLFESSAVSSLQSNGLGQTLGCGRQSSRDLTRTPHYSRCDAPVCALTPIS